MGQEDLAEELLNRRRILLLVTRREFITLVCAAGVYRRPLCLCVPFESEFGWSADRFRWRRVTNCAFRTHRDHLRPRHGTIGVQKTIACALGVIRCGVKRTRVSAILAAAVCGPRRRPRRRAAIALT